MSVEVRLDEREDLQERKAPAKWEVEVVKVLQDRAISNMR